MKSQVLHTVWRYIYSEAAGEIWHWSLLGVKRLIDRKLFPGHAKARDAMWRHVFWSCVQCLLSLPNSTSRFHSPADQHSEWRRQALLLPSLHMRSRHGKHSTGVQRLPGHHSANAPPAVRTAVMATCRPHPFQDKKSKAKNEKGTPCRRRPQLLSRDHCYFHQPYEFGMARKERPTVTPAPRPGPLTSPQLHTLLVRKGLLFTGSVASDRHSKLQVTLSSLKRNREGANFSLDSKFKPVLL